jgi:hypothetical protein
MEGELGDTHDSRGVVWESIKYGMFSVETVDRPFPSKKEVATVV